MQTPPSHNSRHFNHLQNDRDFFLLEIPRICFSQTQKLPQFFSTTHLPLSFPHSSVSPPAAATPPASSAPSPRSHPQPAPAPVLAPHPRSAKPLAVRGTSS